MNRREAIQTLFMFSGGAAIQPSAFNFQPSEERQLTFGPIPKDLDNNINFSPDGRLIAFDCRPGLNSIQGCNRIGTVEVETGKMNIFYTMPKKLMGIGAVSFLNSREVVAIHALISGIRYDYTERGGRIIPLDGSLPHWLDSRDITAPFTAGALRGGTHKHEPDSTGEWVGFTYNDAIMKKRGVDLRNVGVSRRGIVVPVPKDRKGENFTGESFSVLLTECVAHPRPGTDDYDRAEGDCWVGVKGYPFSGGHQRARAFRGQVTVNEEGEPRPYADLFVVDVPDDITKQGSHGPLQGTASTFPKPPLGAKVRRLTRTAEAGEAALRGISGIIRGCNSGEWVTYLGKAKRDGIVEDQVFITSPSTGQTRQISHLVGGVIGNPRFSPDGKWVVVPAADGSVHAVGVGGAAHRIAPARAEVATCCVVSPNSRLVAYNRVVDGVMQVFVAGLD